MQNNPISLFITCQLDNLSSIKNIAQHIKIPAGKNTDPISNEYYRFIDGIEDDEISIQALVDISTLYNTANYSWFITYFQNTATVYGTADAKQILVISIFKNRSEKLAPKLVGIALRVILPYETSKYENNILRSYRTKALLEHLRFIKERQIGWVEINTKLERPFKKVFSIHEIIDPYDLADHCVFEDINIDIDEFHYYRKCSHRDEPVRLLAYGNISNQTNWY